VGQWDGFGGVSPDDGSVLPWALPRWWSAGGTERRKAATGGGSIESRLRALKSTLEKQM